MFRRLMPLYRALPRTGGGRLAGVIAVLACAALGSAGLAPPAAASAARHAGPGPVNWPAYLGGPLHSSFSAAQTAINPVTAASLQQKWFLSGPNFLASPTVAGGNIYIGTDDGYLDKISEATGALLQTAYVGRQPAKTCSGYGVVSTATVAPGPGNHRPTVYVAGGDGYLYAFDAATLQQEWRAVIGLPSPVTSNYYNWSSPTVSDGKIYIGVSSNCDHPLIRGGVLAFDQESGRRLAAFYTVPQGDVGGSVWSSVAVAPDGDVFASTGNGPPGEMPLRYAESIVKLAPGTLKVLGRYQVPAAQRSPDGDFGGSPVIAGPYVGACDKNGIFYLLRQSTMKVQWEQPIAVAQGGASACLATPAYDGTDMYFAGTQTTVDGVTVSGSVQARVATTGRLIWITALPGGVLGSPALDGGGIITAGTYGATAAPDAIYLIDASTGAIVADMADGRTFAQTVFANNWLFGATSAGVSAWAPG